MAWKTFTFYEPGTLDGVTYDGKPVSDILNEIEAQGYEIRFVFKKAKQYTVLARRKAH